MKLARIVYPTAAAMVLLGLYGLWRTGGGLEDYALIGSAVFMAACVLAVSRKKPDA